MRRLFCNIATAVFLALLLGDAALTAGPATPFPSVRTMERDTFSDVSDSNWFYGGIKAAYELGIMDGVGDSLFAPGDTVPWSQAVTIACRVCAGVKEEEIPAAEGSWYAPYAAYAQTTGILPTDIPRQEEWNTTPIDRQSVAYLFYAVADENLPAINSQTIPDLCLVSSEKQAAVEALYAAGIFTGRTGRKFEPAESVTRGELATILTRLLRPSYRVEQNQAALYSLAPEGEYHRFTNHVDGYSLPISGDMTVDMSYSGVAAVLEKEALRLEIYKQDLSQCGRVGYLTYSNGFLENTVDHQLDEQGYRRVGRRTVYVTAWHREALARVENDRNHYVTVDIPVGDCSYSLFLKSNNSEGLLDEGLRLAAGFQTEAITAKAYVRTAAAPSVEDRGWNKETADFYQQYFGRDAALTWGIYEPGAAGLNYTTLQGYEEYLGYQFPILLNYSEFQPELAFALGRRLETAWSQGRVLELTLQTTPTEDGSNMMYDVLQGEYDTFLQAYAQTIRDFGHPVLFRFGNEMNGDWCPYSGYNTSKDTMIYKEAYRYIYAIFQETEANNAIWVWNPNGGDFPNFRWNHALMYYPGDEYVDVVGLTAYNTGTYYAQVGEKWSSFSQLYDSLYADACRLYDQPLMITEFACASAGGDKEAWVEDMFAQLERFDRIKVAVWWDGEDYDAQGNVARSYVIDETEGLMDIFRRHLGG